MFCAFYGKCVIISSQCILDCSGSLYDQSYFVRLYYCTQSCKYSAFTIVFIILYRLYCRRHNRSAWATLRSVVLIVVVTA